MRAIFFSIFSLFIIQVGSSQMVIGNDTLYGNEWIDYDKTYFKIKLAEDGIYRLDYEALVDMGFPVAETNGIQMQIFCLGEEIPIYVTTNGLLENDDYIEFVGRRNRGELDEYLYVNGKEDQLNPEFSLFSDTSAYFLSYHENPIGKRFEENAIGNSNNALDFYVHEEMIYFSDFHHKPTYNGNDHIQYSHFDISEGFGSRVEKETIIDLAVENLFETPQFVPKATIRFGSNANSHHTELYFNQNLKETSLFNAFRASEFEIELDFDDLEDNNELKLLGTASEFDKYSVAFAKLQYPRTTSFTGDYFEFIVEANPFDKYYEFDFPGGEYIIYDLENNHRTQGVSEDGKLKFKIDSGNTERRIIIVKADTYNQVSSTESKIFRDFTLDDPNFLFLTSSKLYDPNNPNNAVKAYSDYRSSNEGGSYNCAIATSEEIIDQFAYGIERHNIGNRNFAFYTKKIWELDFWFNVGKGIEYSAIRFASNESDIFSNRFFVPTFGAPGSDVMMLSKSDEAYPLYNIGRIATTSEEQLMTYIEKVKEHDNKESWDNTNEDRYWMKRMLHLSGGDADLQLPIFNALEIMRNEIEANKFGAEITTLRKFNSTTIDESLAEVATELIDNGVSIITFFGHSSPGSFDFSLEDPSQFENFGKYPLIISLGCFSGNIHTTSDNALSEGFVLEPGRAAIAMLASSGTAYVSPQAVGGYDLYDRFGGEFYTKTISESIRNVLFKNINSTAINERTLMQQLNYHGDPALKFNTEEQVDITYDLSTIKTIPEIVNPGLDSFEVKLDLVNLGTTISDSCGVKFIHLAPDGTALFEKSINVSVPFNREEISITLPVPGIEYLGKNSLEIEIDYLDEIAEAPLPQAESNNRLKSLTNEIGYCFYVLDNGINPVFPTDFSILNDNCPFELKASTNNAFLEEGKYFFEIDTTEFFNSPMLEKAEVISKGGLINYIPSIEKLDDRVYYWRVSPDSLNTGIGFIWKNSSFLYSPQEEYGWNQSHFHQFKKNENRGLELNDEREFIFNREIIDYRFDLSSLSSPELRVFVKNVAWASLNPNGNPGPCNNIGSFLGIHARHPELNIINNTTNSFNSFTCSSNHLYGYYMQSIDDAEGIIDLLESFPDDTRVFMYTYLVGDSPDLNPDVWDDEIPSKGISLIDYLNSLGASKVNEVSTNGTVPYLLIFDKGSGTIEIEEIKSHHTEDLFVSNVGYRARQEGSLYSTSVGKSNSWNRLEWAMIDVEDGDDMYLNIYGENTNGTLDTIMKEIRDFEFSLDALNELSYASMRFEVFASDLSRTPPQIDFIKIIYSPTPDIAMNTNSDEYYFLSDTLQQGQDLKLNIPLDNLLPFDFPATDLEFSLVNESNETVRDTIKISSILAKGTENANWTYNTSELNGKYLLTAIYNPDKSLIEQSYGNNFGIKEIYVSQDKTNPILELTFDGVDILDGDLVSCSPEIRITLSDNNEFLLLDDPSLFEISLEYPDNSTVNLDPSSNQEIIFENSEQNEDNKATLIYTPELVQEGMYTINIKAKDKSGNSAGTVGINKNFEIIKDSRISNVFNYPNPFSTSTQFVFTVTGDSAPQNMYMNIYTLSGKLIRQILPEELGPIRVGVNRTEFKWNGTDEFGAKLANGTYLYKVHYDDPNNLFESFDTSADDMFTNGFGKMVIIR